MIASSEPCTSALMMSGNSLRPAVLSWLIICSSEPRMPVARAATLSRFCRDAIVGDFARARFAVDHREAVAGLGRAGEAEHLDRRRRPGRCRPAAPVSETSARTRPHSAPATTMSPTRSVPRCTSTVATGPRPRSSLASITVPSAGRFGLALRSRISACRPMVSSSLSRLSFLVADTSTSSTSPPSDSTWISCCSSSVRTRSGLASGLSILLIATIIGTFAALAWWIASTVCGMTPSSAATTSTTMSVTLAPRARIAVKAAWPGVSMKVILLPDGAVT